MLRVLFKRVTVLKSKMHKLFRPQVMLRTIVNGKEMPPKMTSLRVNQLRKKAILDNKVFEGADYKKGEWDPRWEKLNTPTLLKPPRGRINLRNRDLKMAKIKAALVTMDDKIKARSKKGQVPLSFLEKSFIREGVVAPLKLNKKDKK